MKSNQTFKEVKKKTDKISEIQTQFKGLNIHGADGQDEEDVGKKSLHENLVYQYLSRTKLEQALLSGLKAAISGDTIPKNPWCEVGRALGSTNLRMDIFNTFETLAKTFRKTPVNYPDSKSPDPYKICVISYTYKEQIKELDEDNVLQTFMKEQVFNVFGYEQNLEYINLLKFKECYSSIKEILPEFTKEFANCTLQVVNSLSGGYVLKSTLIQYPNAHPKDLEIFCECFTETYSYDIGLEVFANFVYEDCVAIQNKKDQHLLKEFIIYSYDEKTRQSIKKSWNMTDIRSSKHKFVSDVIANAKERNSMYWKGYCKVRLFEYDELAETLDDIKGVSRLLQGQSENSYAYQYLEVYKNYNHHCNIANSQQSYAHQPLGSLLKGVFKDLKMAQRYASYFYKEKEDYSKGAAFQNFIKNQLQLVLKKWAEQNIGACAWELFYLAIYIESPETRRNLLDSIIQIISSDYSALISCTKYNNIIRMMMEYYFEHKGSQQATQMVPIIFTTYKILKENISVIFGRSAGSDIIRYRDFIFRLFRETEDKKGFFLLEEKNLQILKVVLKITKFMGNGNLQRIGVLTKNLPQFINEALVKNNLLSEEAEYITFEQFQDLRAPKKMMHVSQEVLTEKTANKLTQFGVKTDQDREDMIILQFMNEYDLFDNLYFILRDIFFGKQIPNALPTAQFRVETTALKYQLFEISRDEVREQMCNPYNPELLIDIKDPTKKLYAFVNEEMAELDMKPIFGLEEVIFYTSVFEISGLKMFLDNFHWSKALKKSLPQSYQIQPVLTSSTYNLFQDSTVLGRTYCEWNLNWDWIIKGPSYQHAQQIFADTILKYVVWLELTTDVIVLGFYHKNKPRDPFLLIDEILDSTDLVRVRETLISSFTTQSRVFFKIIFKLETRFKCVNFLLNLHFIDPVNQLPQLLYVEETPDTYLKVFFDKNDFLLWNKLYPFNKAQAIRLLLNEQTHLFYEGSLNNTMKLELIRFFLTKKEEYFLTMCRVLFSYSENFYNYSREAEVFHFLFEYLGRSMQSSKNRKKFYITDIRPFYEEFEAALMEDLLAYDNIYFDSIGASIMNSVAFAREGFRGTTNFNKYANAMGKLSDMCAVISDSVILTFRQLLLEDYGQSILWTDK